jgi:hypothetical protein
VPVYEARYTWGKETRRFWIYGNDQQVYAPKYPLSNVRLGLAIGLPVAVLAGVAATVVASAQPPTSQPPAQTTSQPPTGRGR